MIFNIRECYAYGVEKEENKRFEFHAFCECGYCKWRQKFLKEPRNHLTVTTNSMDKFPEIKSYIENWRCGQKKIWSNAILFNFEGGKIMNNLEWIKNNAKNFNLNEKDELCLIAYICKYKQACGINKTSCNECEFNNNLKNSLNCLLEEHKEPIKLTQ